MSKDMFESLDPEDRHVDRQRPFRDQASNRFRVLNQERMHRIGERGDTSFATGFHVALAFAVRHPAEAQELLHEMSLLPKLDNDALNAAADRLAAYSGDHQHDEKPVERPDKPTDNPYTIRFD